MATVDFCTAITSAQAKSLDVDGPTPGTSSTDTRSCLWTHYLSEPIGSYSVSGRADFGIEAVTTVGEAFTVGRYKAVVGRSRTADLEKGCDIFIDVRPGQILHVAYGYSGSTQRMTHDLACQKARPVAAMVIDNLDR